MMNSFLIIGAGWLGLPLAQQLLKRGKQVTVTTTSNEKRAALMRDYPALNVVILTLESAEQINELMQSSRFDCVVACFPPGLRKQTSRVCYEDKWRFIVDAVNQAHIVYKQPIKVVMYSTTAVYPDILMPSGSHIMDEQAASAHSDKAEQILAAEQQLQRQLKGEYLLLRLSGLMGPDRHPARFTRFMKSISDKAPANMVHLDDVLGATFFLLDHHIVNSTVNITTPETCDKAQFYKTAVAHQTNGDDESVAKMFPAINSTPDKQISADKLLKLGYQFVYPHTLDALKACC